MVSCIFYHVIWKMDQHVADNLQSEVFISTLFSFALGQREKEKGKCTVGMEKY